MCILKSSSNHLLLLFLFTFLTFAAEAAPTYSEHVCTEGSYYRPNTTFQTNLNLLLSSLISNATLHDGFFLTNVSLGNPDQVKGLFLCRGDVTPSVCHECVAAAGKNITHLCTNQTESIIWYEQCMLRYSNNSNLDNTKPNINMVDQDKVPNSELTRFNDILGATLNDVKLEALNSNSGKKFATKEVDFTTSVKLYTLAQCRPDLSFSDCDLCFTIALNILDDDGKKGAQLLYPGCNIEYELYPFYNVSALSTHPDLPPSSPGRKSKSTIVAIVVPIGILLVLLVLGWWWQQRLQNKRHDVVPVLNHSFRIDFTGEESLYFDLATIEEATCGFTDENKIGEGGFGAVYKGTLPNGQEIAVKRLSRGSRQGDIEFRNEAALVAKLQHRNLVRLLGFCLERAERILVYEFIPNSSLNHFLFDDDENQEMLDWDTRYKIISGIARGIKYLHEDSRLKVIHRDLKASNVLLDADMNPKISDFGLAKIFHDDQSQPNAVTKRIVGTYGYMPPEYAMHGKFSVKSDMFSFGVLVLEIINGKKNSSYYQSNEDDDLLSFAWKNWTNQTPFLLLDPKLRGSYSINEVRRCIHIALLCVQEKPADRPSMTTIMLALNSFSVTLALPRQPASFLVGRSTPLTHQLGSGQSRNNSIALSVNDSLITEVYPR